MIRATILFALAGCAAAAQVKVRSEGNKVVLEGDDVIANLNGNNGTVGQTISLAGLVNDVQEAVVAIRVLKDFVDNDVNTKLVQLKADSDQADIDLVSADAALEDKINTLQDTVGANKGAVDAAQAARNAQSVVQAAADKVVLDTLAALKKVQDAHAVFIKELPYGTLVSDPAKSCQELHKKKRPSGFYYLKGPKGGTFKGYCENDKFEGGWLMIVNGDTHEYKTHWTKANGRKAYGGTPSPGREVATTPLSKLSDDSINGYLNMPFSNTNELHAVFRFETTQCGDGNKNPMYLGSSMKKYDDNIVGMNIMQEKKVTYRYHANPGPLGKTAGMWYRNVFDTPHSSGSHKVAYFGNTHNSCQAGGRYFNGHRNTGPTANAYTCYRSRNGWGNWNQGRCFSLGNSCNCKGYGSHPQAMGIHIYVKSFADYGYKSDTP